MSGLVRDWGATEKQTSYEKPLEVREDTILTSLSLQRAGLGPRRQGMECAGQSGERGKAGRHLPQRCRRFLGPARSVGVVSNCQATGLVASGVT